MQFISAVSALHRLAPGEEVGYGATWRSNKASIVGIVPVGYGDGYPRHSILNTPVWINGVEVPIIGRISMDMMAIDLTSLRQVNIGDPIELWGTHLPVERIARSSGTSGYELLCQITNRPRGN
jgi:alanine racemase